MSQIRRKPVSGEIDRPQPLREDQTNMESIELNNIKRASNGDTIQTRPRDSRFRGSETIYSDPGSYNQPSSAGESSWSRRRLLRWLKGQQEEAEPPITSPRRFALTQDLGPDDYHLALTGYEQVFKRIFTGWDNFFAMLATMGIGTSVPAILFLISIYAGGPKAALTNWIFVGFFSIILALCLGEIAAAMPTSAGLYFFAYKLGGVRGPFLSWVTAWLSWVGWLTMVPASAQLSSNFMFSIFKIHFSPAPFTMNAWFHWFLVLFTLVFFALLPNIVSRRTILWALRICMATNAILIFLYFTWFPIRAGKRYQPSNLKMTLNWINQDFVVYASDTYAWALAALFPAWVFKGFEVAINMSEETKRASRSVATGMWAGVATGWLIGIPVICILFSCTTQIEALANAAVMDLQGFALFLLPLIGHNPTLFILILCWLDAGLVTAVLFMAASRLTFALARDKVMPGHKWLSTVSSHRLPVNAALLVFGYSFFLSMVGVNGTSSFQALLAIVVVAENLSYAIVIFARLTYGRKIFLPANWTLGRASIPLNIIALLYTSYLFLILISPFWFPVRPDDLNFAPIIVTVLLSLALVTWYAPAFGQHKTWRGPRIVLRDDVQLADTTRRERSKFRSLFTTRR